MVLGWDALCPVRTFARMPQLNDDEACREDGAPGTMYFRLVDRYARRNLVGCGLT
jgi:hypothetical protein